MGDRIVVDTNVFVSALRSADGNAREVLRRCLRGEEAPLIGQKLFLEYMDVFERREVFSGSPITLSERQELLAGFLARCTWMEVFFLWRPNLPDEGDNHVFELAVAGGAAAIVSYNTGDFRGEIRFPRIAVLTPAEFLRMKR